MEEAIELVFIPAPGMGHLVSAVEAAKLFLRTRPRLSITVFIMKLPFDSKVSSYTESLLAVADDDESSRLKFIPLAVDPPEHLKDHPDKTLFFRSFVESHKPKVRDCVNEMKGSRIAGFVVDMFCDVMMDVADELGLPTYVFYTSGAAMLGLHLHLQSLRDDHGVDVTEFKDSDPDLSVSTYSKPFPVKLVPAVALLKTGGSTMFLDIAKRLRQAKGTLVNTFFELEPHALESLSRDKNVPPVYPVGPILNIKSDSNGAAGEILTWLDDQPDSSVVFLCFGSGGSFPESQVKEIAHALERSGHRFLWSLRQPPSGGSVYPADYNNPEEVLPEGFLKRTKSIGKVIGWAPQATVLAHRAVGGFLSHCGWNSTLESVWFGVPMATWPIYAEQQANAFQLVTDIGMGVDVKMDYKRDMMVGYTGVSEYVTAKEIETGITSLMDHPATNPVWIKANELKEISKNTLQEGGSSFNFLESFFEYVVKNLK
uniref:Glycosyltransferase n=1 Tax=Ipomoea nil TaxID=35883 RepID=K4PYD5_IPONI|nr:coumarin glucosyltransferase 1 [Ipomoea nil]